MNPKEKIDISELLAALVTSAGRDYLRAKRIYDKYDITDKKYRAYCYANKRTPEESLYETERFIKLFFKLFVMEETPGTLAMEYLSYLNKYGKVPNNEFAKDQHAMANIEKRYRK